MKFGKKSSTASKQDLIVRLYTEKYLKAKVKSCEGNISINFPSDEIPKEGSRCICLSVTLIDSVYRTGKNC